ncbi:M23 family metallopeptidase [Sphingomonas sp. ASV193]|uniref:M23 family metallopeptidase n=1 Tax=Sphingomonas sp. ASV193 TaxID=3144405 RepID=UPI0032E929DE
MKVVATAIVTAILTSAFWLFFLGATGKGRDPGGDNVVLASPNGKVAAAGDKKVVYTGKGTLTVAEGLVVGPAGLAVPVEGVKPGQLVDTFTQSRANGARLHNAIDIMAPEGTPVRAAAPGRIEKLFESVGKGGTTVYQRSDDGQWVYYYAHLNSYAPGLAEGQHLNQGDLVGFVGHSGDAVAAGPHLHFAINQMAPGEKWYQGTPINPYPLLAARPVAR